MIIKKNQVTIKFITTSTIATTITLKSSILRKQKRGQRQPNQARKQRRKEREPERLPREIGYPATVPETLTLLMITAVTERPEADSTFDYQGPPLWITHSSFTKFIPLSRQPLVPVYPRLPFKFRPHSPSPYPVIF